MSFIFCYYSRVFSLPFYGLHRTVSDTVTCLSCSAGFSSSHSDVFYSYINLLFRQVPITLRCVIQNRAGKVRVTYQYGAFAWCSYLLGNPKSMTQFHSITALIWRFNLGGNNKTSCIHVDCLTFCQILNKSGFSRQVFIKVHNIKFHWNPSSRGRADACRWMTDILAKLIGAFPRLCERVYKHPVRILA